MGPNNGLERRAWQFYTICDTNQGLKVKMDEVTAIPVPRSKNPVRGFRNNTDRQLALKCPEDKMVAHLVLHVTCWRYDGLKMVARTYSLPPWCTTMVASASTSAAKAMTNAQHFVRCSICSPRQLVKEIYNAKICRHAFGLVLDDLCNWVDLLLPKAAPSSNKL